MKLAVLAAIAAAVFAAPANAAAGQTIYVTNTSTAVTDASLADALPAFQAAADQDFAAYWNATATLVQVPQGEDAPAGAWVIQVADYTDTINAAGYHDARNGDTPYALVGAKEGLNWQLVFTHELFELLADPHADRATSVRMRSPTLYALEVCDPVERQVYSYTRPGASGASVVISDFVTERWFDGQGGGLLDFTGHVHHALHVLAGGYVIRFTGGLWSYGAERPFLRSP